MRNAGFDLVFIFLLLAMVMDPIKDILAMERPQYSINYLFLDLAILFSVLSFLPMFFYAAYEKYKRL